jgi:hypothetical protein
MKLVKEAFNIYDVSSPAYRLFKFVGLAPLSYQGLTTLDKFKTTKLDKIYLILLVAFHIFMNRISLEIADHFESFESNKTLSMGWKACMHFSVFSKVVCIVHSYQKRKDLVRFMRSIEICDKKVRGCFQSLNL